MPLLLAAAPLALMLRMEPGVLPALLAGLLPGTAVLSLLGSTAAAIVLGARRGGVLLPLLLLPLAMPVLIFGAAAADAAAPGSARGRICCCWAPFWWPRCRCVRSRAARHCARRLIDRHRGLHKPHGAQSLSGLTRGSAALWTLREINQDYEDRYP